ncbi:MAG: DHH family phosphoesterase [bacterium]
MLNQTEQIFTQIDKAKQLAVVFNKHWFGDSVASALAMFLFLRKLDKKTTIIADQPSNPTFSFLPSSDQIQHSLDSNKQFIISLNTANTNVSQVKYKLEDNKLNFIITPEQGNFNVNDISAQALGFDYDLIIAMNSPDLDSLGSIYQNNTDFFYKTPIINLDHQSANENYGQINLVNLNSVATSEILFDLLTERKSLIDEDIATCLLAGIISQTKSFKTNNVTPQALLAVSELINLGARREEIVNNLYRSKNIGVLQLWGKTLAKLKSSMDNKMIWSVLIPEDFSQTQTQPNDLINIIDELIVSIPQAIIIMLVAQTSDNEPAQAIIYSVKNINCLSLVKEFNPQGTKHLVRIELNESAQSAAEKINELIESKLNKLAL